MSVFQGLPYGPSRYFKFRTEPFRRAAILLWLVYLPASLAFFIIWPAEPLAQRGTQMVVAGCITSAVLLLGLAIGWAIIWGALLLVMVLAKFASGGWTRPEFEAWKVSLKKRTNAFEQKYETLMLSITTLLWLVCFGLGALGAWASRESMMAALHPGHVRLDENVFVAFLYSLACCVPPFGLLRLVEHFVGIASNSRN